jgi:hypothetical protein
LTYIVAVLDYIQPEILLTPVGLLECLSAFLALIVVSPIKIVKKKQQYSFDEVDARLKIQVVQSLYMYTALMKQQPTYTTPEQV